MEPKAVVVVVLCRLWCFTVSSANHGPLSGWQVIDVKDAFRAFKNEPYKKSEIADYYISQRLRRANIGVG